MNQRQRICDAVGEGPGLPTGGIRYVAVSRERLGVGFAERFDADAVGGERVDLGPPDYLLCRSALVAGEWGGQVPVARSATFVQAGMFLAMSASGPVDIACRAALSDPRVVMCWSTPSLTFSTPVRSVALDMSRAAL